MPYIRVLFVAMGISVSQWRQSIGRLHPGRHYKRPRPTWYFHEFRIIQHLMYYDTSGLRDFTMLGAIIMLFKEMAHHVKTGAQNLTLADIWKVIVIGMICFMVQIFVHYCIF